MITVIKSDIPVSKINFIKEIPPCLKNTKQEELSSQDPFELLLSDHESILDERKRRNDIEHQIILDKGLLEISDDKNSSYQ